MTRILNAESENYSPHAAAVLREAGTVDLLDLDRAALLRVLPGYDALIVRLRTTVDAEVFAAAPGLRAIVSATTGTDHIDLKAAAAHGVEVLTLRGETNFLRTIPATVEHTLGLMLALVRKTPWAHQSVLAGNWDRDTYRGQDLRGKTLGLLGVGRIGEAVAALGRAFGMQVIGYDPYRDPFPAGVRRLTDLPSFLAASQILSVHVALTPETVGMVGADELAALPRHAYLINTSRGAVLDEAALLRALEAGQLTGAALDVVAAEHNDPAHRTPLIAYARTHKNLLITPHIGGATAESMAMTEIFMARRLAAFLQTR